MTPLVRFGRMLVVVSCLVIGLLTLTPAASGDDFLASPWCLACGQGWAADAVANILMFIPLGAGLALGGIRPRRALAAVALTTLGIELLQLRVVAGRDASLSDLLTNFCGGVMGYGALRNPGLLLRPPHRRALVLAATWSTLWIAGTATTAWALAPLLPATLWARWHSSADTGRRALANSPLVLHTTLAGSPIPGRGPVEEWPALRPRVLGGAPLVVRVVLPAPATAPGAQIAELSDADSDAELITLTRRGDGVTFFFRTRAALLRLRTPVIASGDFLSPVHEDTALISGSRTSGLLRVDAEGTGGRTSRTLSLSPNWGWSFLLPSSYALGREVHLFTALWIAGLVLPIAYWAAQGGLPPRTLAGVSGSVSIAAPGLALWIIPLLYNLPAVHWSEWLAWGIGSYGGWMAGRAATRAWRPAQSVFSSGGSDVLCR